MSYRIVHTIGGKKYEGTGNNRREAYKKAYEDDPGADPRRPKRGSADIDLVRPGPAPELPDTLGIGALAAEDISRES